MQLLTLSHENLRLSKWPELYYFSHILSSAVTRYLILNKQNYIKMVLRNIQHAILGDGWYDESGTCYVLTKPNQSKPTPCSLVVSCFVSYLFLCDEPAKKVYCENHWMYQVTFARWKQPHKQPRGCASPTFCRYLEFCM